MLSSCVYRVITAWILIYIAHRNALSAICLEVIKMAEAYGVWSTLQLATPPDHVFCSLTPRLLPVKGYRRVAIIAAGFVCDLTYFIIHDAQKTCMIPIWKIMESERSTNNIQAGYIIAVRPITAPAASRFAGEIDGEKLQFCDRARTWFIVRERPATTWSHFCNHKPTRQKSQQ